MAEHNKLGSEGEKIAIDYLRSKGYEICHTNWRSGHYEIDIVAVTPDELVVVEVKTRSGYNFEAPERAVDERKIRRIVYATDHYIKLFHVDLPPRFDIITVIKTPYGFETEHIVDAFYPPLS
ncbi:MAG: YraN family protein [Bacteroidales bacterium]